MAAVVLLNQPEPVPASEPEPGPSAPPPPERGAAPAPAARRQAWQDLGAAAVVIVLAQLAAAPLAFWWFDDSLGPIDLAMLVAVTHGGMFVGTLWILRRRGAGLADLGCVRPARGYRRTLVLVIPALLVMWLVLIPLASLVRQRELDDQLPIAASSPVWLPLWVAIAGVVGFVEELLFRGLVLRRLATVFAEHGRRGAFVLASLLSSLLFGLLHGFEPGILVVTTTIGLYLAFVTLREGGNLVLVMLVHAAQDSIAFTIRSLS
jgi:membrane protease YdiL (CAAX protease family)